MLKLSITQKDKIFDIVNIILLSIFALSCIYPLIYCFSASISSGESVSAGKVLFFPKGLNLESFQIVFSDKIIWMGYANTIFYTVVGTASSVLMTVMGSYALSKKRLWGRKFLTILIVFTMWLNIHVFGIIPFYLNISDLHLINSRLGIIIAFLCNAFYIILMRNYFESVHSDIESSAKMDGANDWQTLWFIYIPLSKAAITTIALFYAVSRWNGYFWSMVLLQDESKIPLQVYLKKVLTDSSRNDEFSGVSFQEVTSSETISAAIIVVSIIPVIVAYPFVLKYFNKGSLIGGVKE